MKSKKMLSFMVSAALLTSPVLISNNIVKAKEPIKSDTSDKNKATVVKGVVNTSALNVRGEASTKSKILTVLRNTDSVEIVDSVEGWYKIKLNSSYGYVAKQYISVSSSTSNTNKNNDEHKESSNAKQAVVTASALNVRGEASANSKILTVLRNNSSVEIIDSVDDWYKIKLGSSYGYVVKKYVSITNSNAKTVQASKSESSSTSTLKAKTGKVIPFALNVRDDSSLKGKVLAILKNNTSIEIVDSVDDWYKIKLDSKYGYVSKKFIKLD